MATTTTTASTDPVLALYGAVRAGDPAGAAPVLTEDVVLHVPGRQPLSGDHVGRQAVIDVVSASSNLADRTAQVELVDLLVGGDHVAAYGLVTGRRDGRTALENRTVHLFRVEGHHIAEIWFHNWDQGAVDAFWS